MFNIIIIGVGGTGGDLAPSLARLIGQRDDVNVTLVDGDDVELHNLERQPYIRSDVGMNKALCLTKKINNTFGCCFSTFPNFIKDVNEILGLMEKSQINILVGAVDNYAARRLMEIAFYRVDNMVYIDSANEDSFGDVILGLKNQGKVLKKTRGAYRPLEVFNGTERIKERSCERKVLLNPQTLVANKMASNVILAMIHDLINGKSIDKHFINFDLDEMNVFDSVQGEESNAEQNYFDCMVNAIGGNLE